MSGVYVSHVTPKTSYSDGVYGINVTVCTVVSPRLGSVLLHINYTLSSPEIGLYEDVRCEQSCTVLTTCLIVYFYRSRKIC